MQRARLARQMGHVKRAQYLALQKVSIICLFFLLVCALSALLLRLPTLSICLFFASSFCLVTLPRHFASSLRLVILPRHFASSLCLVTLPRHFASSLPLSFLETKISHTHSLILPLSFLRLLTSGFVRRFKQCGLHRSSAACKKAETYQQSVRT